MPTLLDRGLVGLSVLLPPRCVLCRREFRGQQFVCPDCIADVVPNPDPCPCCAEPESRGQRCGRCQVDPQPFHTASAPWLFAGALRELIHAWKFDRNPMLTPLLAELLAGAMPANASADLILPIPLHWRRRWSRGFDQTWLLANALQRALRAGSSAPPPVSAALRRTRHTPPQAQHSARARRSNLRAAFACQPLASGTRVVLLDDVLTTGATAAAAAEAVLAAGAAEVHLLCLARAPGPKR